MNNTVVCRGVQCWANYSVWGQGHHGGKSMLFVDGLGSFISGVRVILCKVADLEFVGSKLRSTGETKDLAKNLRML